MKTQTTLQRRNLKIALVLTVLGLLTACGNSKSNSTPADSLSSNRLDINSVKPMANCNKSADNNFSFNSAIVNDQTGQPSNDWIKIKFNFLSADMTKTGNIIKIFKWRVSATESILDPAALQFAAFDLSSGQTLGSLTNSLPAEQISGQTGYYVQLNDPNAMFQVLKIVSYDSEGKIVGSINSLIPAFSANPADYKLNSDGTNRADILMKMHQLNGAVVTGWSAAQFKQAFDQYCF